MRTPAFRRLARRLALLLVLVAATDIGLCAHGHHLVFVSGGHSGPMLTAGTSAPDHHASGHGHGDCFCHGGATADRPAIGWSDPSRISPVNSAAMPSRPIPAPRPLDRPPQPPA